jgi:hypothetical protein
MAAIPGTLQQQVPLRLYSADGKIASGSAPQLILPAMPARLALIVQNESAYDMWVEIGPARAHVTINGSGQAASVVFNTAGLDNAGFNYTYPPKVSVIGGAGPYVTPTSWPGSVGQELWENTPSGPGLRPATILAAVSGGAISGFTITDPGAGYTNPPELYLENDPRDPFGCADPSIGGGTGLLLKANGSSIAFDATACPTGQVAIFCATATAQFSCRYMV